MLLLLSACLRSQSYYSKANVKADNKEWYLTEIESSLKTHPCDKQYEILGSTVSYS